MITTPLPESTLTLSRHSALPGAEIVEDPFPEDIEEEFEDFEDYDDEEEEDTWSEYSYDDELEDDLYYIG